MRSSIQQDQAAQFLLFDYDNQLKINSPGEMEDFLQGRAAFLPWVEGNTSIGARAAGIDTKGQRA